MRRLVTLLSCATLIATTAPAFAATMGSSAIPSCAAGDPVVWFNTSSKAEHMSGDKYYGKTKHGSYLCKSVADAQGGHAAGKHGMNSSKHASASTGADTSAGDTSTGAGTMMNPASSDASPAAMTGHKHRHHKGMMMASPAPEPAAT